MAKNKATPKPADKKAKSLSGGKAKTTQAKKPAKKSNFAAFKAKALEAAAASTEKSAPKPPRPKMSATNRRENSSGIVLTAALIVAVLALNVLVYAIVTVTGAYFPLVKEKDITVLSDATDHLFDEAKDAGKKVRITFFYSFSIDTDVKNHSTGSFVYRTVENFQKKHPGFIEVNFINLVTRYSELDEGRVSIEKYQNTETPLTRYSVAFECGSRIKIVTDMQSNLAYSDFYTLDENLYATSYDGEQFIAGMICNVTRNESLKAYLVKGHSETLDPAFGRLLTLAGYEYDPEGFDISKSPIPEDCDLLVISNPISDFESVAVTSEIKRLESYIERGGNLMVMLDPVAKKNLKSLEALLANYGITVSRTTLETDGRQVCEVVRDTAMATTASPDGYTFYTSFAEAGGVSGAIASTVKKYTDAGVAVSTAGSLKLSGNAQPVLVSSKGSRCEVDGVTTNDNGSYVVAAVSKNPASQGNVGESTIFVMSGIYSTASGFLTANGYANRDFYYSVLENAFGAKGMPYGIEMAISTDVATIEGLTMRMAKVYFALVMLVPATTAVVGTVIVVKRKNR